MQHFAALLPLAVIAAGLAHVAGLDPQALTHALGAIADALVRASQGL